MPIIEKLTIPPLYTHSIDYDNNLTIYEAYGAMLHTLNETIDILNNVTQNIIPALTNRVAKNEKNISLLLEYVDTLQQQMSTLLNTTIPAINSTLSQHNSRITVNENDILKLKNDIVSINTALTTINSRLNNIDVKISNLENNYTSLNFSVNHHTEELNTINSKIEEIQTVLAGFNSKITANENSILNINTEITEINQKLVDLNIDEINSLLTEIKQDVETANDLITELNNIETAEIILDTSISTNLNYCKLEKNGKNVRCRINIQNNTTSGATIPNQPHKIGKINNENFYPKNSEIMGIGVLKANGAGQYKIIPCIISCNVQGDIDYVLNYFSSTELPSNIKSTNLYAVFNYFTN